MIGNSHATVQYISEVKLRFLIADTNSYLLKISHPDLLGMAHLKLFEQNIDSTSATISVPIKSATMATIVVNGHFIPIYLDPGYDLTITGISATFQDIQFSGNGSDINNYLIRFHSVKRKFERSGGRFYWQLNFNEFKGRYDSARAAYKELNSRYLHGVVKHKRLIDLLLQINTTELTGLKANYAEAQFSDLLPDSLKSINPDDLFSLELLKINLNDYNLLLNNFLRTQIYRPIFFGKDIKQIDRIKGKAPLEALKSIKQLNIDSDFNEFLQAKNIAYWYGELGPSHLMDSLFSDFKTQFRKSRYMNSLIDIYNRWMPLSPGRYAPSLNGMTVTNKKFFLSDLKGQIVYVDVWATWCGPCLRELPFSKKIQKSYKDNKDVVFLYVSVDKDGDAWKKMITSDSDWEGVHINSDAVSVYSAYLITGIPRYVLIDRDGKIAKSFASRPSSGEVEMEINELLKPK
jgi:thiol-disulfide isomerase/thioredoxin